MGTPMKCGCTSHATTSDGKPACMTHDCYEPFDEKPDLTGRTARCSYRHGDGCEARARESQRQMKGGEVQYGAVPKGKKIAEAPSSWDLPFFSHKPDEEYDEYYCGCLGWS